MNYGWSPWAANKTCAMPHLPTCLEILRRLIAKGDMNGIRLAERDY
jgi:hypothetical protein